MTLSWDIVFYLGPIDTLSLYIRIEKLDLLRCYFSFGSNLAFCQVKEDYKKSGLFEDIEIVRSY